VSVIVAFPWTHYQIILIKNTRFSVGILILCGKVPEAYIAMV